MKKTFIIVVVGAVIIALVSLLSHRLQNNPRHHAIARLWVDPSWLLHPPAVPKTNHFDPDFFPKAMQFSSNYLCQTDIHSLLAVQTQAAEKDFQLTGVNSVRGTLLINLFFEGTDSNQVMCVASNAAVLMVNYYSTNQPDWDVHFTESYYYIPENFWQRQLNDVRSKLYWIFHQ